MSDNIVKNFYGEMRNVYVSIGTEEFSEARNRFDSLLESSFVKIQNPHQAEIIQNFKLILVQAKENTVPNTLTVNTMRSLIHSLEESIDNGSYPYGNVTLEVLEAALAVENATHY